MSQCKFHSICTMEVQSRENYVREVELEALMRDKLIVEDGEFFGGRGDGAHADKARCHREQGEGNRNVRRCKSIGDHRNIGRGCHQGLADPEVWFSARKSGANAGGQKKKKMLCAVLFTRMREHTAFLTFATVGNGPNWTRMLVSPHEKQMDATHLTYTSPATDIASDRTGT